MNERLFLLFLFICGAIYLYFGLKIGARFTDEVDNDVIRDVVDALGDDQLTGTLVEVEDVEDNERVHIFID